MITEAIVSAFAALLRAIADLLPDVTFPYSAELDSFASFLADQMLALDSILPMSELVVFLRYTLTVYVPFVLVFVTIRWIYSHIPGV